MTDENTNPYCSPALSATVAPVKSAEIRRRYRLVVAVYLVLPIGNVVYVLWPQMEPLIHLISSVALATMTTYWCVLDSRLRRKPIVRSLHWIIFLTWPIAVPIYLIGSRKVRGLGLALAHGIGLFTVAVVTYLVAGFVAYGEAWLDMFMP